MTPTTPLARTLAWMEAIAGQFYLAILVAGLVGIQSDASHEGLTSVDGLPRGGWNLHTATGSQ